MINRIRGNLWGPKGNLWGPKGNLSGLLEPLEGNFCCPYVVPIQGSNKGTQMGHANNIAKKTENNPDKFAKLGQLANAKFSDTTLKNPPSLQALKLQDVLMKNAGGRICEDMWHEIDTATFKHIAGMRNFDRHDVIRLLAELRQTLIQSENLKDGYTALYGLISVAKIDYENNGQIKYQFDPVFRDIAENSDLYAVLDYRTSLSLSSKYSHRLYDMIALRAGRMKTNEIFTVDDLRAHLGVQAGKLPLWKSFRVKALETAIAEINQSSRFNVSYRVSKKERRKTTEIELNWTVKDDLRDAKREQAAHSTARKGRRAEAAEKLSFPKSGSVRYSDPWERIARDNCNWDHGKIADAFRSFCSQRKLKLDAKTIEKVFTDFCRKQPKL